MIRGKGILADESQNEDFGVENKRVLAAAAKPFLTTNLQVEEKQ
jgi:hypothetical protein